MPFHTRSPAQVDFSASVQVKFKASNPQVKERKPKPKQNKKTKTKKPTAVIVYKNKQTTNQTSKQTKGKRSTRVEQQHGFNRSGC